MDELVSKEFNKGFLVLHQLAVVAVEEGKQFLNLARIAMGGQEFQKQNVFV